MLHALRVYTLSGRNKILTAVTFALSLVDFIVQLVCPVSSCECSDLLSSCKVGQAAWTRISISLPPFGCSEYDTMRMELGLKGVLNLDILFTWAFVTATEAVYRRKSPKTQDILKHLP